MPLLHDATVDLSLPAWLALQPAEERPIGAPGAFVTERAVTLRGSPDAPTLTARWVVHAEHPAPALLTLAGDTVALDAVTVDGAPVSTRRLGGQTQITLFGAGTHVIEARGALTGGAATLLPAAVGWVDVGPGLGALLADGRAVAEVAGLQRTGAAALALVPNPPAAPARDLLVGAAQVGVTVRDAEVEVTGILRAHARRGAVRALHVRAAGFGPRPTLEAPPGATATPTHDGWHVALPARTDAAVTVRGVIARPAGDVFTLAAPTLSADELVGAERTLVVARDADDEVLAALRGGRAVDGPPPAGLVGGAVVTARQGDVSGQITVAAFRPAPGPALLVDVADLVVAPTPEGRALIQATWTVRNERAAALDVRLPPGATVLAARVDGAAASAAVQGDRVRVPLPRSVETARGALAFPVELTVLTDGGPAWARRADVAVTLPAPDAPIAVRRVTVDLPRGWDTVGAVRGEVTAFSEGSGLAYGFGVGGEAQAQEQLYRSAVASWMENDFAGAQRALDDLRAQGADNENVARLQSNLDVVADADKADTVEEKKVLELARARAEGDVLRQDALLAEAELAAAIGDEARARQAYEDATAVGDRLQGALAREKAKDEAAAGLKRLAVAKAPAAAPAPAREALRDAKEATFSPSQDAGLTWTSDGEDFGDVDAPTAVDAPPMGPIEAAPHDGGADDPDLTFAGEGYVEGGVEGGVVGGVVGGAQGATLVGSGASTAPPPAPPPPAMSSGSAPRGAAKPTTGRRAAPAEAEVTEVTEVTGYGAGVTLRGGAGMATRRTITLTVGGDDDAVNAVAAAVVVPVTGEVLRVQTLLLPAADLTPVHLTVRPTPR